MSKSIYFPAPLPVFKPAGMLFFCLLFSASLFAQGKHDTTSYIQTVDVKTGKIDTVLVAKGISRRPTGIRQLPGDELQGQDV